jgi:DNA adenine methylase
MFNVQPIIKWAGGKRKLAPIISNIAKEDLSNCDTYIEPFFGGGAVYFDLYNNQLFKNAYVNDIVPQLVSFYKTIAQIKNIEEIHSNISEKLNQFNSLNSKKRRKDFFYDIRIEFNSLWVNEDVSAPAITKLKKENSIRSAILLYVLNKTCFNGLFRVNKKGGFNVPLGSYKTIAVPSLDELKNYSKSLNKTKIFLGDYEKLIDKSIEIENSFTYLDPPYVENSKTSNFTSYSKDSFKDSEDVDAEHIRLSENFDRLIESKSKAILSNHNNSKAFEIFVDGKSGIFVYEIDITKTIGRVKGSKNTSSELLISTFEIPQLMSSKII